MYKKNAIILQISSFHSRLEGSRGRNLRLSYLASRARTHAKRARTRTACRQSHPRGPLTPLQTSPSPDGVLRTGLYRVFTGAVANHCLRASGLRPQPWHHIEVLIATCGACLRQLRWRFFEPIEQKNRDLISDRRRVLAKNRTNRTKNPELIEPGTRKGKRDWSSYTLPQLGT